MAFLKGVYGGNKNYKQIGEKLIFAAKIISILSIIVGKD